MSTFFCPPHGSVLVSTATKSAIVVLTVALGLLAGSTRAEVQDRSRSDRARLELSFDHGGGWSSEDAYGELALDLRIHAPMGLGVVLRAGLATQIFSNAGGLDLGAAYRVDLLAEEHVGVQLALAIGASVAYGPFDGGSVVAAGGFAMLHLDVWYRSVFVGLGVSSHALLSSRHGQAASRWGDDAGRADPILTVTPMLRIGGEWGL